MRVAVVDGHTLVREGLKALLQLHAGIVVAAEIAEGGEIGARLAAAPCDVVLLDQHTWLADDCDIRELREYLPVLLVADDAGDPGDALTALRHGACGVVFRSASVASLLEAIRTVAAGGVWMPPKLQLKIAESLHEEPLRALTPREREIARHVAVGLRNGEIAGALRISEQTVKTHLGRIFRKLEIRDRVGLALYARRHGLTSRPEAGQ
ncbi:MAG: response regulator transcription factor [Deltaproteobacteria bacterium]|nr:response regulator transcription factor [Deltaproteobacteria bacterium]